MLLLAALILVLPTAINAQEVNAEQFAEQAYQKYEKGAFPEAIALYMKSYEISRDARILFNVAQIYDKKIQDRELAIDYYRRYLKTTTTEAELVKRATERIAVLSAASTPPPPLPASANPSAKTAAAPPTSAPTPTPAPTSNESTGMWIGWTTTGTLALGALITGLIASNKASDAKNTAFVGAASGPADDKASSAKTMALVSTILTGGALVAGGISIYLSTRPSTTTALTLRPGSVALEGRFL